jgi:hypothetical protein
LKFIGCRNDESIIEQMKKLGRWEKMQALSKPGETANRFRQFASSGRFASLPLALSVKVRSKNRI